MTNEEKAGFKHDNGKLRWTLIPWRALREVVEVLNFGALKYDVENWKNLDSPEERYLDALLRHVTAHAGGETRDPETGFHHLAHAVSNALFLLWFASEESGEGQGPQESARVRDLEAELAERDEAIQHFRSILESQNDVIEASAKALEEAERVAQEAREELVHTRAMLQGEQAAKEALRGDLQTLRRKFDR